MYDIVLKCSPGRALDIVTELIRNKLAPELRGRLFNFGTEVERQYQEEYMLPLINSSSAPVIKEGPVGKFPKKISLEEYHEKLFRVSSVQ